MNRSRLVSIFVGASLVLASCGSVSEPPSASGEEAEILASIEPMTGAYPDAHVTDLVKSSGATECGLLRSGSRRPHVVGVIREGGSLSVAAPVLIEPGSWESENNRQLSNMRADLCRRLGAEVLAY